MTKRRERKNATTVKIDLRKYNFKQNQYNKRFEKINTKMMKVMALMFMLTMKSAIGLRCYTCNSHFDPLCGDPFFDHHGEVSPHLFMVKMFMWGIVMLL